jgi:hypothetical protein
MPSKKHGPWMAGNRAIHTVSEVVADNDLPGEQIAHITTYDPDRSIVRLMAAAPDLADALKALVRALRIAGDSLLDLPHADDIFDAEEQAVDALKKAGVL